MSVLDQPEFADLGAALAGLPLPFAAGVSVKDAVVHADAAHLVVELGYPMAPFYDQLHAEIAAHLLPGMALELSWRAPLIEAAKQQHAVAGVANIIAVASGKGGVGKSTTSANLALALAAAGAKVGVLDADIYGPSQALMLGVEAQRPQIVEGNRMVPLAGAGGVQLISMANLVTKDTPMVWRGPMASGALQQLLRNTVWDGLDYLIVDMPPGTGDIQLTLAQTVPVAGAVIVTTPQDIALLDAVKGIEMFRKVAIAVLGVVENMATHTCSQCGHTEAIFGEQGGERLAEKYATRLLGRLPLKMSIREQTDRGAPPVIAEPSSEVGLAYRDIALRVAAELWQLARAGNAGPAISVSDD